MVRVVRLERTVSWSQTRRDTNFAIPGYSISAIISRRGRKSKIFLSVVIYVVKATFIPLSAIGESPANTSATRLCGVSPCPVPDTATALPKQANCATPGYFVILSGWSYSPPKQAPYQLNHSRMPVGHYTPSVRKKQPENTYPRAKKKSMNYKITGMPGLP